MSDIIERVANNIQTHMRKQGCDCLFLEDGIYMQGIARTAIEAMREPTAKMAEAACKADIHLNVTGYGWMKAWKAMIKEALK